MALSQQLGPGPQRESTVVACNIAVVVVGICSAAAVLAGALVVAAFATAWLDVDPASSQLAAVPAVAVPPRACGVSAIPTLNGHGYGGGGLMLFYEPEEDQRMGVLRVEMAKSAGANVIVTACPFCLVNIEDAIKVAGLEGEMEAIDLCELIEKHMIDKE